MVRQIGPQHLIGDIVIVLIFQHGVHRDLRRALQCGPQTAHAVHMAADIGAADNSRHAAPAIEHELHQISGDHTAVVVVAADKGHTVDIDIGVDCDHRYGQ